MKKHAKRRALTMRMYVPVSVALKMTRWLTPRGPATSMKSFMLFEDDSLKKKRA
jgi:hypothetical protein